MVVLERISTAARVSPPFLLGLISGLYLIEVEIVGDLYVGLKYPVGIILVILSRYFLNKFRGVEIDEAKLSFFYFCCGLSMATIVYLFINPNWNANQRDWKIILCIGLTILTGRVCYEESSDFLYGLLITWTISVVTYWVLNLEWGWRSSAPSSWADVFPIVAIWILLWSSDFYGLTKYSKMAGDFPAIESGVIFGSIIFWLEFEAKSSLADSAKWIIAHVCLTILVLTLVRQSKITSRTNDTG